ncbi:FAD-dependent oxidoreductase [Paenibacillus alginolyticus]|uniref:FAD-dependent oxidoreductase n=1 Tax=Paenibacillus alginolyticus TaxID=59839 RepID=A0ABT4GPX2_9BACL|nr:FAD-dependent oxidoreductase [Paenibacillus alginolyticus]MCY9670463.1 FAD-dependent oxidoreductase [Paenibacillus alginolyticus]MCY9698280.1 FAD-dependent oxidoreductase [Paenibacillus alginolyticus]MEC0147753.1 FAD-dependent oxidoreductase [Paenibacillus alginolyticus]
MNYGEVNIPAESIPVSHKVDVVVIGGGPAGIAAAISAAANGAKTLLIEQRGFLGGMGTVALVPAFCPFTDKVKPVIRGLGMRLMERMKQSCNDDYRKDYENSLDWVPIDPEVLKRVYDDAAQESGVSLLYHTFVYDVVLSEDHRNVEGIIIVNKSGRSVVSCRYVIDATGDADIAAKAGVPFQKGGEQGELQSGSMCYLLTNVDRKKFNRFIEESGDTSQLHQTVEKGMADGALPTGRKSVSGLAWVNDYLVGVNFGHIFGIDGTKAEDLTRGALEGRRLVERQVQFFRAYVPGFENAHVVATGEQVGIRETRRIQGDYVLTADDFMQARSFEDDIARNAYYIDIHMATSKQNMTFKHLEPGQSHGVPYRILLPVGIDNMWVPGRAASSDRAVQGSLRVMPNCFAMGEASGTAAALALKTSANSREVAVAELQMKLLQNGVWLGEKGAVR